MQWNAAYFFPFKPVNDVKNSLANEVYKSAISTNILRQIAIRENVWERLNFC